MVATTTASADAVLLPSITMQEGAGAKVRRLFPTQHRRNYDPFVLLDEFAVDPPTGFPDHPHRGFEAISYLLAGGFRHTDNLGNTSEVGAGGAQAFTAGSGLIHSELPLGTTTAHGLQLWINLPQRLKGMDPAYQEILPEDIPTDSLAGVTVREIVGPLGPVKIQTPMLYRDVTLEPGVEHDPEVPASYRGFLYVLEGAIAAGGLEAESGQAILLEQGSDWTVASEAGARFMLVAGEPHGEPIRQYGPFVD